MTMSSSSSVAAPVEHIELLKARLEAVPSSTAVTMVSSLQALATQVPGLAYIHAGQSPITASSMSLLAQAPLPQSNVAGGSRANNNETIVTAAYLEELLIGVSSHAMLQKLLHAASKCEVTLSICACAAMRGATAARHGNYRELPEANRS